MTSSPRYVHVIDDERHVRVSLSLTLRAAGVECRPFASAADFLDALPELSPGCLLLDLKMPGIDGLDLLAELARRGLRWPVIVVTAHSEVPLAVRAMKLGAVEFLEKPVDHDRLKLALEEAFASLQAEMAAENGRRLARARVAALTAREMDVFTGLLAGLRNRVMAERLGLRLRTVEAYRAQMMKKLEVSTVAEALAIADRAGTKPRDHL